MNTPMQTKQELVNTAKSLIESNPTEAVKTYRLIYEQFPNLFTNWDAFDTIKAMRNVSFFDFSWATDLAYKFRTESVCNMFSWLVFDKCVKSKEPREIIYWEPTIKNMAFCVVQKNLKEDNSYPCPKTISILKLCEAHSKNSFNAQKIDELLNLLDHNLLSNKPKSIDTQARGEMELASDFEKYLSLKTKALEKLNRFDECIYFCNVALQNLTEFHNDNDLWFKKGIAISEKGLGNTETSEALFQELLNSKKGSKKWFLYRDLAEIYFEKKDFDRAWKYAVEAIFYGNEPHFMIRLYLLQARILFKLNRIEDARVLAELIASILNEQQRNSKEEYVNLFVYFRIDRGSVRPVKELIKLSNDFWRQEKYQGKAKITGVIVSIHPNGKVGRIKTNNGKVYTFSKRDFERHQKSIENLKEAEVEFYTMKNFEDKDVAESIVIKSLPTQKTDTSSALILEGEIIEIRNDNERGKEGFVKSGDKTLYFSVNPNYPLISKIIVGTKVSFEAVVLNDRERARIKRVFE